MDKFGTLLAMLFFSYCLGIGNAAILPENFPKYHSGTKEIHLKHGKLHPHHDNKQYQDDDHIVYRYRWLEDDIVKSDDELEGVEDDEYTDKEKKVKLPGGCELTENQYLELESFKKETQYVKKCYCENGGVYCQLNKALFKQKAV